MARRVATRPLSGPTITVIGEGLTERRYFEHLRKICGFRYNCKPRFFTHSSLDEMCRLIDSIMDIGGIAVCVFDADISRGNDTKAQAQLKHIHDNYLGQDNVILCDSMPSIEFWFLLHFLNGNRYYASSGAVVEALRKHISGYDKTDSFLSKSGWVTGLCSNGKLKTAVSRAKHFGQSGESYSNIYKAIELFEKP